LPSAMWVKAGAQIKGRIPKTFEHVSDHSARHTLCCIARLI
jgi:hypothetical protein